MNRNTNTTVRFWIDGQHMYVQPACEKVLAKALSALPHGVVSSPGEAFRVGRHREKLYEIFDSTLRCWVGYAEVVLQVLHQNHIKVESPGGIRFPPLPAPIVPPLAGDAAAIRFVAARDHGVIRYHPDCVDPMRLVANVARAWPTKKITFAVTRTKSAGQYANRLRKLGIDAFAFADGRRRDIEKRVAVATYMCMIDNPISPEWQDVVIAEDAAEAIGTVPMFPLEHVTRARLYGMLPLDRRLSRYEQDLIHGPFGFDEHRYVHHEYGERAVEVAWLPSRGRSSDTTNPYQRKREEIWSNRPRNELIARVARAFEKDDLDTVRRELLNLGSLNPARSYRSVLLVVESVDHVVELLDLLPGWRVFCLPFDGNGLSTQQQSELPKRWNDFETSPFCCIATHAVLPRLKVTAGAFDVVIRADGGRGLPCLPPGVLTASSDDPAGRLLLVDIEDRQSEVRTRDQWNRRYAYIEAGWASVPQGARLERRAKYLCRRPTGGKP